MINRVTYRSTFIYAWRRFAKDCRAVVRLFMHAVFGDLEDPE